MRVLLACRWNARLRPLGTRSRLSIWTVPPLGLLDVLAILPNQLRASNHVKLNLNKESRLLEHLWRSALTHRRVYRRPRRVALHRQLARFRIPSTAARASATTCSAD